MMCHSCKAEGHKYLACCEICDNWYCAKCQYIKADARKILIAYKSIHWFCLICEGTGGSAVSNAKYNSPNNIIKIEIWRRNGQCDDITKGDCGKR